MSLVKQLVLLLTLPLCYAGIFLSARDVTNEVRTTFRRAVDYIDLLTEAVQVV